MSICALDIMQLQEYVVAVIFTASNCKFLLINFFTLNVIFVVWGEKTDWEGWRYGKVWLLTDLQCSLPTIDNRYMTVHVKPGMTMEPVFASGYINKIRCIRKNKAHMKISENTVQVTLAGLEDKPISTLHCFSKDIIVLC